MILAALEKTLYRAIGLASARKHEYATLEHLLLALTEDEDAVEVFIACGVDVQRLQKDVIRYLDNELAGLITNRNGEAKPTAGFQRVMQRAKIHVESSGKQEVSGANVLVALYSERESHCVYFLQEQDMSRLDAVNYIAHGVPKVASHRLTIKTDRENLLTSFSALPKILDALKLKYPGANLKISSCEFVQGRVNVGIDLLAANEGLIEKLQQEVMAATRKLQSALNENSLLASRLRTLEQRYSEICVSIVESELSNKHRHNDKKGEKRQCAIVFMDVVGLSKLEEGELLKKIQLLWSLGSLVFDDEVLITLNTWGDAIAAAVDDPNVAVQAAWLMIKNAKNVKLDLRIGIHWGEVNFVFNRIRNQLDFVGDAVNLGARLEPIATPGEILASADLVECHKFKPELFIAERVRRTLKKGLQDKAAGTLIDCYRVEPREN